MDYVTTAEAARLLGITPAAVRRRVRTGTLRAERAGEKAILIPVEEIERAKENPPKATGRPLKPDAKPQSLRHRAIRARKRKQQEPTSE